MVHLYDNGDDDSGVDDDGKLWSALFFLKVETEQAYVCPFPFDIIQAYLKDQPTAADGINRKVRRRRKKKTSDQF